MSAKHPYCIACLKPDIITERLFVYMNYGKRGVREKQRALNSKTTKVKRKFLLTILKFGLAAMLALGIWVCSAGLGAYMGILANTPQIRLSDVVAIGEATIIYDNEGNEIDQYVSTNSNRIQINDMDLIPDHLAKAFVAAEDKRFYEHNGIDFIGMFRAGYQFIITGGEETQGASTITQQLLKNTIFTEWTSEGNNFIKKVKRKIQEQYLALEISKYYSKDDVLLRYMNAINLGQNTLGVESASQRYFGKSCSDLTLSESTVIAVITQNPSGYNPIRFPESNAERRRRCLNTMLEENFITQEQYDEAIADTDAVYERISLHDTSLRADENTTAGSYFSDAVYEVVRDDLVAAGYSENLAETMLTSGGLRIYSTMDPTIQQIVNEEFANPDNYPGEKWLLDYALTIYDANKDTHNFSKENMTTWFKENKDRNFNLVFNSHEDAYAAIDTYRAAMMLKLGIEETENNFLEKVSLTTQPQAAMVIQDQETGYVVAMMGGRGVKEGRRTFNRATDAVRQPGSTFKVLASFAPAIDSAGLTLGTVFNDAPFNYNDGKPVSNWYSTSAVPYRGIQSLRSGIRDSLNIIAVKTLTVISPRLGYDYLENFGFTTLVNGTEINGKRYYDMQQPLALGGLTHGVKPIELNAAYAAIANNGTYTTPKLYTMVTDAEGNIILDNTAVESKRVLKESTAYLLTDAMEDVVTRGTGTACNFDRNMGIAGKTGSTSDYVDVWFAGYTPYYTCTSWAGYDNNIPLSTSSKYKESAVAQNLWSSIMKRVHENLPSVKFEEPEEGIVSVTICSRSGLLPIPGLCDATLTTEIYAEGTEPTLSCNIHYQGDVCNHDRLPATAECPFKVHDVLELPLLEDPMLIEGSTMITENPDGTQTVTVPRTSNTCQHDAAFFANPDYETVINQQQRYIDQRNYEAMLNDPNYEEDDDDEED